MIFTTLNSKYELDEENKRVRRLEGVNNPTPNQGPDGEWKEFVSCLNLGGRVVFYWAEGGATTTSAVVDWDDSPSD